jgi:hypothetical protein
MPTAQEKRRLALWLAFLGVLTVAVWIIVAAANWQDVSAYLVVHACWALSLSVIWGVAAFCGFAWLRGTQGIDVSEKGRWQSRRAAIRMVLLCALACNHFAVGTIIWIWCMTTQGVPASYTWPDAWPCFVLMAMSLFAFVEAVRRRRFGVVLLALTVLFAACAFWYDVSHERWQISVFLCDPENSRVSGQMYFTWFWY